MVELVDFRVRGREEGEKEAQEARDAGEGSL